MATRSRRQLLGILGTAGAASISGCLSRLRGALDPPAFTHPPGFDADAIDVRAAFGRNSAMATVDSVTREHDWTIAFGDFTIEGEETARFAFDAERFRRSRRTFNSLTRRINLFSAYFDSIELISRERVEPRSLDYRYSARSYTLDPREEMGLDDFITIVDGVDVELSDVNREDGVVVGSYTAQTTDFAEGSLVHGWGESFGEARHAELSLGVTEAGHLTDIRLSGTFDPPDGDPVELTAAWRFEAVDATDVVEPDWLVDVPSLERPDVAVAFDEVPGDSVEVEILSMEHTGEVAVVVDGRGVLGSVTTPGTITIDVDEFTADDGRVRSIHVLAEDGLRGPVEVDQFWPTPPQRS